MTDDVVLDARRILNATRDCTVCDGYGFKLDSRECGECSGTGTVNSYPPNVRRVAEAYLNGLQNALQEKK